MLRKFRRTVNQLIRRGLLSKISEALFVREEGFFTEWKLGNTPNEKPRNPAFGGVFFCLMQWTISALLVMSRQIQTPLMAESYSAQTIYSEKRVLPK